MTDYPEGEWSPILVGHVWPTGSNLHTISSQSNAFAYLALEYQRFEDSLHQARIGPLSRQEGLTAENLRDSFQQGEKSSREIAEKNEIKKSAYESAQNSIIALRSKLTEISQDGCSKIKTIEASKEPAPIKIDRIIDVVLDCQIQANTHAAICGDNIISSTQKILDQEGISTSARKFSIDHGVDSNSSFSSPSKEKIQDQIQAFFHRSGSPIGTGQSEDLRPSNNASAGQPEIQLQPTGRADDISKQTSKTISRPHQQIQPVGHSDVLAPSPATPASPLPQVPMPAATAPQIAAPSVSGPSSLPNMPSLPNLPAAATAPSITPGQLLQGFDHGMQTGTPMSAAANALAGGPMATIESHLPPPAPETPAAPAASNIPASTHAAAYEASAHSPAALTEASPPQNHTATADSSTANTTYLTAPAGALPPTPAGTSPTSSLPAYGTDIRPPAPTTSTTALPTGLHPSAPVSPSSAGSNMSQPAVVRQPVHPTASVQGAPTPPRVVARAVASTAAGAAAGAASATTAARKRLQQLVDAVSRQEPHLRWAAGDRRDGTTVLVTDLASGWIPPHIDVPVGMELCVPAYRSGSIQALLGEVTVTADYTSLHGVPPITALDPVPTSPRARQLPVIEELGWQLGQATQRRDGLPRLACTLAIAAARSTGVLDSEVELLRMEVDKLRTRVLQSYPDNVEPAAVTDWQLLAAIDALVHGDKIGANYHFSWFQAWGQASVNRQVS